MSRSSSMFLYKKLLKSWTTISSQQSNKEQNLGLLSWPQSQTSETAEHSTHAVLLVVIQMLNSLQNLEGDHPKQTTNNTGNIYFVNDSVRELMDVPSYIVLIRVSSWILSSYFHIKKEPVSNQNLEICYYNTAFLSHFLQPNITNVFFCTLPTLSLTKCSVYTIPISVKVSSIRKWTDLTE
jgi:hypothetical protein